MKSPCFVAVLCCPVLCCVELCCDLLCSNKGWKWDEMGWDGLGQNKTAMTFNILIFTEIGLDILLTNLLKLCFTEWSVVRSIRYHRNTLITLSFHPSFLFASEFVVCCVCLKNF